MALTDPWTLIDSYVRGGALTPDDPASLVASASANPPPEAPPRELPAALQRSVLELATAGNLEGVADLLRSAGLVPVTADLAVLTQPWWQSRTMLASATGIVVSLAGVVGITLDAGQVLIILTALGTLATSVATWYYRRAAVRQVDATLLPTTWVSAAAARLTGGVVQ